MRPRRGTLASTFSIVARDPETRELGVAVQSHAFSVGNGVPWARFGVGAVATQSFMETSYGPRGLRLLRRGMTPKGVLQRLVAADPRRDVRQVAIVDARGRAATWTGKDCIAYAGHRTGRDYSVQGNLLASDGVWDAMGDAFESQEGPLAERLVATLVAGQGAGGDARGMQSASLLVVGPGKRGNPWTELKIDLRVEDHSHPIDELQRLLKLQRAYDHMGSGEDLADADEFEAALAEYDQALALAPRDDEILFWRAALLMRAGRKDRAVEDARRAIGMNPGWRRLLERLTQDQFPGAMEVLRIIGP